MSREYDGAFMVAKARMAANSKSSSYTVSPLRLLGKRIVDVLAAIVGLIVLSPLFVIIAIRIKQDSPGPVFYRGPRAGKDGRLFHILKFRTMYDHPESYRGPKVTARDDPRITPLGAWLRYTKLNELPQLWNVLKGEMSLVGPRPEDPEIVKKWPEDVRREILSVRPGITSPAAVLYRHEESLLPRTNVMETYLSAIAPDKLRLDQLYVRHMSFGLDLDTILWTFLVLAPRLRGYQPNEKWLFLGPISRLFSRYLNWFLVDTLIALGAISLSVLLWGSLSSLRLSSVNIPVISVVFTLIYSLSGMVFGVQKISWSRARGEDVMALFPPTLLATTLVLALNEFTGPDPYLPRMMLLVAGGLAFTGFVVIRYRSRLLRGISEGFLREHSAATLERVLIIGGGDAGQMAAWMLTHGAQAQFHVVGFVDDDLQKVGTQIAGLPVLGRSEDILNLVESYDVGAVVFAIHNIDAEKRQHMLDQCAQANVQVIVFPDFKEALRHTLEQNGQLSPFPRHVATPVLKSSPGIAPAQVESWFRDLQEKLARGDVQAAQREIIHLRKDIRSFEPGIEKERDA